MFYETANIRCLVLNELCAQKHFSCRENKCIEHIHQQANSVRARWLLRSLGLVYLGSPDFMLPLHIISLLVASICLKSVTVAKSVQIV